MINLIRDMIRSSKGPAEGRLAEIWLAAADWDELYDQMIELDRRFSDPKPEGTEAARTGCHTSAGCVLPPTTRGFGRAASG